MTIHPPPRDFDEPEELDLGSGRPTYGSMDPALTPFLNVLVHIDVARSRARSGLTSAKKQAALSRVRTALKQAVQVIDDYKEQQ